MTKVLSGCGGVFRILCPVRLSRSLCLTRKGGVLVRVTKAMMKYQDQKQVGEMFYLAYTVTS